MSSRTTETRLLDEDDLTVDDRSCSRYSGKKSGDIISAVRDTIGAGTALLETDPDAVLVSERAEARSRAVPDRLPEVVTRRPTY